VYFLRVVSLFLADNKTQIGGRLSPRVHSIEHTNSPNSGVCTSLLGLEWDLLRNARREFLTIWLWWSIY
jgi:hypothetical protein